MKRISLVTEDFKWGLFINWADYNLKWEIHRKLKYKSFKREEFWEIRYRFRILIKYGR